MELLPPALSLTPADALGGAGHTHRPASAAPGSSSGPRPGAPPRGCHPASGPPAAGSGAAAARTAAPGGSAPVGERGPGHCAWHRRSASVHGSWPDHGQNNGSHTGKPLVGVTSSAWNMRPDPGNRASWPQRATAMSCSECQGRRPLRARHPGEGGRTHAYIARGCTRSMDEKQVTW